MGRKAGPVIHEVPAQAAYVKSNWIKIAAGMQGSKLHTKNLNARCQVQHSLWGDSRSVAEDLSHSLLGCSKS